MEEANIKSRTHLVKPKSAAVVSNAFNVVFPLPSPSFSHITKAALSTNLGDILCDLFSKELSRANISKAKKENISILKPQSIKELEVNRAKVHYSIHCEPLSSVSRVSKQSLSYPSLSETMQEENSPLNKMSKWGSS